MNLPKKISHDEMLECALLSNKINGFQNSYRWLSNFWQLDKFVYDNITFETVENFYVAMKVNRNHKTSVRINQNEIATHEVNSREYISTLAPNHAKVFGRTLTLRHDWDEIKLDVMEFALKIKFNQPKMKELLLATRDIEIIELNRWGDVYWGVNLKGEGDNNLGKIIMRIREELKKTA